MCDMKVKAMITQGEELTSMFPFMTLRTLNIRSAILTDFERCSPSLGT